MEDRTAHDWFVLLSSPETRNKTFSEAVGHFQERIYWHIRRIVVTHDNANDVMQNTFLKAWKYIDNFRGDSKFSTWLFRIATNESIDYLNGLKKEGQYMVGEEGAYLQEALMADPYFDGDALQQELQKAILLLPDKQRLVFNMRYFDEMKYDDISDVLGVSVGALKASYHIAQKKIQAYFQAEE